MNLRVVESTSWPIIEKAAEAASTCIQPAGVNNARAKESFQEDGVRYFIQEARDAQYKWSAVGYVRVHLVSQNHRDPLWIVDFVVPFNYRAVRLVHQQLEAPLLIHKRSADDWDLAEHWPKLPLRLPKAEEYSFRQCQGGYEGNWLLVS